MCDRTKSDRLIDNQLAGLPKTRNGSPSAYFAIKDRNPLTSGIAGILIGRKLARGTEYKRILWLITSVILGVIPLDFHRTAKSWGRSFRSWAGFLSEDERVILVTRGRIRRVYSLIVHPNKFKMKY